MARIEIDRELCMTSGQCTYLHPELFRLDADGKPEVLVEDLSADGRAAADEAADVCPSQAISIVD